VLQIVADLDDVDSHALNLAHLARFKPNHADGRDDIKVEGGGANNSARSQRVFEKVGGASHARNQNLRRR